MPSSLLLLNALSGGGWIFLLVSWGFIGGTTIYCFYKVLRTQEKREEQGEE